MASTSNSTTQQGAKRGRIYEEENDRNNKRNKIEGMDEEKKALFITYAVHLALVLGQKMQIPLACFLEVISSTHIMALTYRVHDYARGTYNVGDVSEKTKKRNEQSFTIKLKNTQYSLTSKDSLLLWNEIYAIYSKKMNFATKGEFFSKSATVMALLNLFYQRMRELQVGPDSWISTKREGNTIHHRLSTYGINPAYRHMASGLSWDVNVRNTLSKHTTGLCQLAILSDSTNKNYSNKNKINVERDYGFLDHIDIISDFVQTHDKHANFPILDRMARITHLHGDKHKRRCSPCFSSVFMMVAIAEEKKIDDRGYDIVYTEDRKEYGISLSINTDIGFSSKKAALMYNQTSSIMIPSNVDATFFKQFYFHATFGTQGEDFGILSFMTNERTWHVRENYPENFFPLHVKSINPSACKNERAIELTCYSKNISATQTNMLSNAGEIIGTMPVFAAFRTESITEKDLEFAEKLKETSKHSIDSSSASIIEYLNDVIKILSKEIRGNTLKNKSYNWNAGRTSWMSIADATYEKNVNGNVISEIAVCNGKSFWAKE